MTAEGILHRRKKMESVLFFVFSLGTISCTKMYSGQRIFNDFHIIDFVDPAKHGFHIILNQQFVDTHLQPTKLPTVYASAIPLKRPEWNDRHINQSTPRATSKPTARTVTAAQAAATRRVTKILYPENGGPEDGLLDGRTIKVLGLQERSWYFVCVEFESNLNRHEMATGLTCLLKRTLDKFGKTIDTTVNELELLEITDRSITVQLVVEVDFPLSLTVYLDQSSTSGAGLTVKSVPAQTFVVDRSQTLNVMFGPFLDADVSYGRLCVLEEPFLFSDVYTAMGRAVGARIEHCYFDDLKTKPVRAEQKGYQEHFQMAEEPDTNAGSGYSWTSESTRCCAKFGQVIIALLFFVVAMQFT